MYLLEFTDTQCTYAKMIASLLIKKPETLKIKYAGFKQRGECF